jgi:hypothetical protein
LLILGAETILRGLEFLARFVVRNILADLLQRLQRKVKRLGGRGTKQPISVIE